MQCGDAEHFVIRRLVRGGTGGGGEGGVRRGGAGAHTDVVAAVHSLVHGELAGQAVRQHPAQVHDGPVLPQHARRPAPRQRGFDDSFRNFMKKEHLVESIIHRLHFVRDL